MLKEPLPDGETLSDDRDIDCSPIIAAIEKAEALLDSLRFDASISLFSSAIIVTLNVNS